MFETLGAFEAIRARHQAEISSLKSELEVIKNENRYLKIQNEANQALIDTIKDMADGEKPKNPYMMTQSQSDDLTAILIGAWEKYLKKYDEICKGKPAVYCEGCRWIETCSNRLVCGNPAQMDYGRKLPTDYINRNHDCEFYQGAEPKVYCEGCRYRQTGGGVKDRAKCKRLASGNTWGNWCECWYVNKDNDCKLFEPERRKG